MDNRGQLQRCIWVTELHRDCSRNTEQAHGLEVVVGPQRLISATATTATASPSFWTPVKRSRRNTLASSTVMAG